MATIALQAAGNALLPGVGGVIGAAIGGYIDNTFLFPAPDTKGPRLNDLAFQSGSEGAPLPVVLGSSRVPGAVIWKSKLIKTEHEAGGKGGGPTQTTYSYSVDVAVAICEGPIYRVAKIFANGNLLYNADADVSISSNQIACTRTEVNTWNSFLNAYQTTVYQDLTSPSGGPDLSQLVSGKNCVVAGFANANNNGTFRVLSSSLDEVSGNSTARLRNANAVTATSSPTITITQDLAEFSPNKAASFTFYTGTTTQTADPLIESYEGTGEVPAYRSTAYVVIERLQLGDFGNSMPQLQFLVEQVSGTKTLADAVSDIMLASGREASDFDVTGVTGNLRGYAIRGPQTTVQKLRPLLLAYDIVTQQKGAVLYFFNRSAAEEVAITTDEEKLAAHEGGSDTPRLIDVTDIQKPQLPVEVNVLYTDTNFDEQQGCQKYRGGFRSGSSDNVMNVDLTGVVLTPSEAQDVARRTYWTAHANRQKVAVQLPPSMMLLQENDVLTVTAHGTDWRMLIGKADRGANWLLQCEGLTEESEVLTFTGSPAEDASHTPQKVYTTPEMDVQIIDFCPLRTEDEEVPGYYRAASFFGSNVVFQGASHFVSDDDSTYTEDAQIPIEATMGRTTGVLSGTSISVAYWDRKSTVNVRMQNGELASAAESDVLNGANVALIGREILAFSTATLESDGTYTLSNLIRGLGNTEDALTTHLTGDVFVLLSGPGITFRGVSYGDIDRTKYFKAVALGGIVSQFTANQQVQECNTLRHWPPAQIQAQRNSSGDIVLSWQRRTRGVYRLLSTSTAPLLDTAEVYQIEIWNDAETGSPLRTLTVTGSTTTTYSNTDQVTDFSVTPGVPKTNLHVKAYQVHSITGRSKAASAVV